MDFLIGILLQGWHLILYYLLPFIIVIGIMIFFHELGHFLLAKAFGVKVLKFALGYGPPLLTKQIGETEYSIRYFPLGGFVKMLGEDIEEEDSDEIPSPDDIGRSFTDVHVLKRIAIVAAGPVFNIVLSFFLFFGMFMISGTHVMTPIIGEVQADSPAQQAGLQKDDRIISIQNHPINSWDEIRGYVSGHSGEALLFHVQRGEKILSFNITPRESTAKNEFGEETKTALIGIVASGDIEQIKLSLPESVVRGMSDTIKWIKLTFLVIIKLFQGVVPIKTIGGPGENKLRFRYPFLMALDKKQYLYIVDVINTRVQVVNPDGLFVMYIGGWGVDKGHFFRPKGVAVDTQNRVYVSDSYMGVIQVFDTFGQFYGVLGNAHKREVKKFRTPTGMFIDDHNRLYVVEMLAQQVSVYRIRARGK